MHLEANLGNLLFHKFRVLFEDPWFLALDKPAGLLTIPAPNKQGALLPLINQLLSDNGVTFRLHPCHRLDRETSGVLLLAKGKKSQKLVMELFHTKQVGKTYFALVQGNLEKESGRITRSIDGKEAITFFRVLERRSLYSLVEVKPETGRTNQIRLHFKALGHPLVGETKYAFRKDFPLKASRLMLHAVSISFTHPFTEAQTKIEAPLPEDMLRFLEKNHF
ncbi:MAG: RluA family pseudouridine synthase [Spirochaetales bacterium]